MDYQNLNLQLAQRWQHPSGKALLAAIAARADFSELARLSQTLPDACVIDERCDFRGISLADLALGDTNLPECNAEGAQLSRCTFAMANLSGTSLVGARITDCIFAELLALASEWPSTVIAGSVFDRSDLNNALFSQSTLKHTRFLACSMRFADFSHATVTDCVFDTCDMSNGVVTAALFERCDFTGSHLAGTQRDGARFVHCTGLE